MEGWFERAVINPGENMISFSMKELLEAGVHFGHRTCSWNPAMAPYIYGARHKQHIINLETTVPMFKDMLKFVYQVAAKRGKILFVGTKYQASEVIRAEAERCGMPFVSYRWLGGMLTNYKTIRQSIKRLKEIEAKFATNSLEGLTKKERLNLIREKAKLENALAGIKDMGGLPDALFIIDVEHEKIAISEASRLKIPVAAIVDTNCSMDNINYPVPGNDDAIRAIRLYCQAVADTILEAKSHLQEASPKADDGEEEKTAKKIITRKAKTITKKASEKDGDVEEIDEIEFEPEQVQKAPKKVVAKKHTASEEGEDVMEGAPVVKKAAVRKKPAAKKTAAKE